MNLDCVLTTDLPQWPVRRGKVRDVYDLGDHVLLVATDRISAFDWVLPTGIPDKGRVLTQISVFWFDRLATPHHLLTADVDQMDLPADVDPAPLAGRSMLCRKSAVVPIECVVRGYLSGSGWKEYQATGEVCGVVLPHGLQESDRLPEPIFTPATKAEEGHDENISFERMVGSWGPNWPRNSGAAAWRSTPRAPSTRATRGILIADTKFEFGLVGDEVLLIDEVLTPDSSPLLARRPVRAGPRPAVVRQAVRPRLAHGDRLGQEQRAPSPTPGRGRENSRKVRGGV